jgi:hypothetical protein
MTYPYSTIEWLGVIEVFIKQHSQLVKSELAWLMVSGLYLWAYAVLRFHTRPKTTERENLEHAFGFYCATPTPLSDLAASVAKPSLYQTYPQRRQSLLACNPRAKVARLYLRHFLFGEWRFLPY